MGVKLVVTNPGGAAKGIAERLDGALKDGLRVLWLLSGGSNLSLQMEILKNLEYAERHKLTVSMIDERFVPLESPHNNWHSLMDLGLNGERARLEPPVIDWALSLDEAALDWEKRLKKVMGEADVIIGQFGMGVDGHTAGILPHSPVIHETTKMIVGYRGSDFERLTTTPAVFKKLDMAALVTMGPYKKPALKKMGGPTPADELPVQLLRQAKELVIYTDQEVNWQ